MKTYAVAYVNVFDVSCKKQHFIKAENERDAAVKFLSVDYTDEASFEEYQTLDEIEELCHAWDTIIIVTEVPCE